MVDLRISIREKGVFACFHPDAGDLFNVCSDLKRVCWTLFDIKKRLEKNVCFSRFGVRELICQASEYRALSIFPASTMLSITNIIP
jgi:hypothetical protein